MDLPNREKTFLFDKTDDLGERYCGDFKVKCILTMADRRMLEIEKSRIKGDVTNPSPDLAMLALILANLRVRVIDGPDWWKTSNKGELLSDETLVGELFDEVMKQEVIWRDELKAKSSQAVTAGN
jgi:hypothetical protein